MSDDLYAHFTQTTRFLQLTTTLGADRLLAECVRGEEAIRDGYSLSISALSLDANIRLRELLGKPALVEMLTVNQDARRVFHGHLTAVELLGSNGGMARYSLTLRPWTQFLALGRDSRVFHDMNVFDILDTVFKAWQGRGQIMPAWRFDIADLDKYPARSLTTQYQESDLAFVRRLMADEGLFDYFEHRGEAASALLGEHRWVIADHNGAFQPNEQFDVRYTQPGAVMKEDSIDRWRSESRHLANGIELQSWDYRSVGTRPVSASSTIPSGGDLLSKDVPGQYGYVSRSHGRQIADRQMEAIETRRRMFSGSGTVRTFTPGTTFALSGHAVHDRAENVEGRTFLITRVVHLMHNNLNAELSAKVDERIGKAALSVAVAAEQLKGLHPAADRHAERPLYRNRIDAIPSSVAFRASRTDGSGRVLHPRPTVYGQQTAIVVGPPGAVIHTDRDHRVKVQFHWQRGDMSHSRLSHPNPEGHTGAPADESAGTWVRVAVTLAHMAGANWGGNALPRVGQEVLVDFMDGDIDRPVVIGALYNGAGVPDAQANTVVAGGGAATGNAAAWFPGEARGHAHAAVLSGIKSQAMQASQGGSGAYSQLVFDDSPGQARVALQRYASPFRSCDELSLGHLRHQADNQRLGAVGFGAEFKTDSSAAVRAGRGMLVSAHRRGSSSAQLDSSDAHAQIESSKELQATLAATAQKHNAKTKEEPEPAVLAAIAAMDASAGALAASGESGSSAVAYTQPILQVAAPSGIVAATPGNVLLGAADTSGITAGQDINHAVQANSHHLVYGGIGLFTYGRASNKDRPVQQTGIKLHAASGKVVVQSQSGETKAIADKAITVASVAKNVSVSAREYVLLTAQGASLKLKGGNIELQGPGKIEFKASRKELAGPQTASGARPTMAKADGIYNEAFVVRDELTGEPMANVPYRLESAEGTSVEGVTDAMGRVQRVFTKKPEELKLFLTDED